MANHIKKYSELLKIKSRDELTYQELLLTDEWSNKRIEILNRDLKRCSKCNLSATQGYDHYDKENNIYSYLTDDGTEQSQYVMNKNGYLELHSIPNITVVYKPYHLQIHHKYYVYNKLPWDYPENALITLCNWCHTELHESEEIKMYYDDSLQSSENLIPCSRCFGAGWFPEYNHVKDGVCFECNGKRFTSSLIN